MKAFLSLALISVLCTAFAASTVDDKSLPKTFFPLGRHSAKLFGGMMTSAGNGFIEFAEAKRGGILLTVGTDGGKEYKALFSQDRTHCVFLESVKLDSMRDFAASSGGALGERVDRSWSSDRYTVMIGYTLSDRMHVVYLRDRLTNDPLLIAKFSPPDAKL